MNSHFGNRRHINTNTYKMHTSLKVHQMSSRLQYLQVSKSKAMFPMVWILNKKKVKESFENYIKGFKLYINVFNRIK